jgi:protein-disulfide isomerase
MTDPDTSQAEIPPAETSAVEVEAPANSHVVRNIVQGGIALLIIAAVIIVVAIVITHKGAAVQHPAAAGTTPTPKNMASYGVLMTGKDGNILTVRTPAVKIGHPVPTDASKHAGTVNIVEYIDYQCPICLEFEKANLNNTAALVASGKATLEIHPVSFLDRSSEGTRYSSRAYNAAACVANYDPDEFLNATAALYEFQPAEGSTGLTNAQILKVLSSADVSGSAITKCV